MFLTQLARRPRLPYLYYVDFSKHQLTDLENTAIAGMVDQNGDIVTVRHSGESYAQIAFRMNVPAGFYIFDTDFMEYGAISTWVRESNVLSNIIQGFSAGPNLFFNHDPNGCAIGFASYNSIDNYCEIRKVAFKQAYYLASGIKLERWLNYTGSWNDAEEHIANNSPDYVTKIREFYVQNTGLEKFLHRLTATVVFVADMNVRFAISSDDQSRLRIKVNNRNYGEICSVKYYTLINEIDKFQEQISDVIEIKTGDKVEFEVIHREGGHIDHLTVHIAPETGDVFAPLAFLEV